MSIIQIKEHSTFRMAFRAGSVDEQVIKDTFVDDMFFKGVPEYSPKGDDVIIDVGAHIGAFTVQAAMANRSNVAPWVVPRPGCPPPPLSPPYGYSVEELSGDTGKPLAE